MTEVLFETKFAEEILIEKASTILKAGGIIVVPTDTIPGIGCLADNADAVNRLFKLKNRPENLPIPVILAGKADIRKYAVNIHPKFDLLADKYWPGPLTIVLQSKRIFAPLVGGGKNTIGFRVPDSSLVRGIVRESGFPLALTSANPHSVPPTADHEKLLKWWKNEVDIIIIGRSLKAEPPSTVVDLTTDPPKVIREGIIYSEELCEILGC